MIDSLITIIKEHAGFRHQIGKLAKADLIKTYSGSALGWMWAIIKPLTVILVYWFAFSIGLKAGNPVEGYPFILWLVVGLVPWFYMDSMFRSGTLAMRNYSYLITKMKFPVSTISTIVSLSNLVVNLALMIIVTVFYMIMGYHVDIYFLQMPFYFLIMFLFFTAWSMFSAPLAAVSKDFWNLVKSGIMAILWVSGVLWNPRSIDSHLLRKVLSYNPVTYITDGFRRVFIYKEWFFDDPKTLAKFGIVLLIMVLMALFIQKRLKKDLPDVL
jgi:teichoic acid transport system permease protein